MAPTTDDAAASHPAVSPTTRETLDVLADAVEREDAEVSGIRLVIERGSAFFGSPSYFAFVLLFIAAWIGVNEWGAAAGWKHVDEPPFFWLQGIVSTNALLLTIAVLIRQNRMAKLAAHRAHLDLQINLLTERKVTKALQLIDELRRRPASPSSPAEPSAPADPEVADMVRPADPEAILQAIKQQDEER